jgi:2-oxoglutarate ferredoxin oxidoreductase subunit alpha
MKNLRLRPSLILLVIVGAFVLMLLDTFQFLRPVQNTIHTFFRPITIWPSPEKRLYELGQKFDKVLSVELNQGQYLEEIQRAMGRKDIQKLTKTNGRPFSPQDIIDKVKEVF